VVGLFSPIGINLTLCARNWLDRALPHCFSEVATQGDFCYENGQRKSPAKSFPIRQRSGPPPFPVLPCEGSVDANNQKYECGADPFRTLPGSEVDFVVGLYFPCRCARGDCSHDEQKRNEESEDDTDKMEAVDVSGCECVGGGFHEIANGNQHDASDHGDGGREGGHAWVQHSNDHHRKDGNEIDRIHFLQVSEDCVLPDEKRRPEHRCDGYCDHEPFRRSNGLLLRAAGVDHMLVEADGEKGRCAVQRGVE